MGTDHTGVPTPGIESIWCEGCSTFQSFTYPSSHFVYVDYGNNKGLLCDKCADTPAKRTTPIWLVLPIIENRQLDQPIRGNFKPIDVLPDDPGSGAYEYWRDIGHLILEEMAIWQHKLLKFSFGGIRYKGLWLKPQWIGSRVAGITVAGDAPKMNLELDVYQHTRLSRMGFSESGRANRSWSIELREAEGHIPNAASIILHILRFGYLLEPSDLSSITPTLDIDINDAEWKRPRR